MKKNLSLWMLGIAAMLASCSQDEELLQGTECNGTATFTVTLDEDMKTRAVDNNDDLSLTAYVLDGTDNSVVKTAEGSRGTITAEGNIPYTFTVSGLSTEGTYRIVCWAYNAEEYTADATTNLTLTAATGNPGIAYYGNTGTEAQKIADMNKNIPMTHAVGKVTLVTTKSLEAGRKAKLSVPTYKAFNLLEGTVVTTDATTMATAESIEGVQVEDNDNGATLCSVYVLCGSEVTNGVTVTTLDNGVENGSSAKTIDNVPVKPNVHVTLKGDANLGIGGDVDFTAEIATEWDELPAGDLDEYGFEAHVVGNTITTQYAGQIAAVSEVIAKAVGTGSELKIEGPMNSDDFAALKKYLINDANTELSINLTAVTELTEIPNNAFSECTNLSSVQLSDNITRIGAGAFSGCTNLTMVNMPQNLISMGAGAFYESGLSGEIELPEGFTTFDPFNANNPGMQFDYTKITALTLPESLGDITVNTIRCYNCDELKTVTFKSTVKELFYDAFADSPNLTDVYMLGNATEAPIFPEYLFDDKTKVTIHVPQGALSHFSSLIEKGYNIVEITE